MSEKKQCVVIDYGIGNVFSVCQALKRVGSDPILSGDPSVISNADRLILPGVGAFGRAAGRMRELNLVEPLYNFVETGRPFLGICVGMQLLMSKGYEFGEFLGLGLFEGTVEKVDIAEEDLSKSRVPLIGWNCPRPPKGNENCWTNTPFEGQNVNASFYFVHSYSVRPKNDSDVLAIVSAGSSEIVAAIGRDNIFGVQFHPERSAQSGMRFLNNFLAL